MKLLSQRLINIVVLIILASISGVARSNIPAPVSNYKLDCNDTFSCPDSLMPRVAFWVEVFSRWDTNTAIFHDKENPQRVYSTVRRKEGCRRSRTGDKIDKERKKLKKDINRLANKLEKGQSLSRTESNLNGLFSNQSASQIRSAADRIRCQSGNRDRMANALAHFMTYRPVILHALEEQSLTEELQYLPFVESAFNPNALSHVGAAGLWQIMPSTGRTLGLKVDTHVDQRYDPRDATYAAARYFRNSVDNLTETAFENGYTVVTKDLNPFVITSYNYGVRGMQRAIKQVGLDYERLLQEYKSPSFQTAVKNFYASFLAARHVAKNSAFFFGEIEHDSSNSITSFNTLSMTRATSAKRVSESLGIPLETLKKFNPALKRVIWKHKALIPRGFALRLPYREEGWSNQLASMNALPKEIERPGFLWHRVRAGQTACGIARRYKASCAALRRMNNLNREALIYTGKRIKVPTNTGGISVASTKGSSTALVPELEAATTVPGASSAITRYRVKRGDTACNIARKFAMKCDELLALNGLTRRSVIKIGQNLSVTSQGSWHRVRRGETACGIAERYRVNCSLLLDANRLSRSDTIRIGQRLRIPTQRY